MSGAPAPRIEPWDIGGVRSDDGWNRGYAHPEAAVVPADPRGIDWRSRCPACGATFTTTCGRPEDAAFPDGGAPFVPGWGLH